MNAFLSTLILLIVMSLALPSEARGQGKQDPTTMYSGTLSSKVHAGSLLPGTSSHTGSATAASEAAHSTVPMPTWTGSTT